MKRKILALGLGLAMSMGTVACGSSPSRSGVDVEDCDFEDRLEGDKDCDTKKTTKKKAPKKPVKRTTKKR